jgi:galactokinase
VRLLSFRAQIIYLTRTHRPRWAELANEFEKRYGRPPTYIARAPGRVNLIGEHIDYALFGVFPAAVERDILIACAPRPAAESGHGHVQAQNLNPKYTQKEFAPARRRQASVTVLGDDADPTEEEVHVEEWHMDLDKTQLRWESYVKAGYFVSLPSKPLQFFVLTRSGRLEPFLPPIRDRRASCSC